MPNTLDDRTPERASAEGQQSITTQGSPVRRATSALLNTIGRHRALVVMLLALFIARLMLADWNSYWNDEIISVYQYGTSQESLFAAVEALAAGSIHPPLYQSILYLWIQLFGDLEVATRTLSNIFMTLASGFLYAFLVQSWAARWALIATLGFSISASATYYGLETRSYAMTMMLAAASSYVVWKALRSSTSHNPTSRTRWGLIVGALSLNSALMLVHYYNVFWLIAQALFIAVYLFVELPRERRWKVLTAAAALAVAPFLGFLALWGIVLLRQFRAQASAYAVDGSVSTTPLELLNHAVVIPNVGLPQIGIAILMILFALTTAGAIVRLVRTREQRDDRDWSVIYLAVWCGLPVVLTVALFALAGVERFSVRYFLFSVAPLSALIVITALQVLSSANARGRDRLTASPSSSSPLAAVTIGALVVALFLPGGVGSATERKADWRGIAKDVVVLMETDTRHSYTLIDTSFGSGSRSDYYFARFSEDIQVDAVASRRSERNEDFSALLQTIPSPESADRLVLVLNHHRKPGFPNLIELLEREYGTVIEVLNEEERGFIVFGREG